MIINIPSLLDRLYTLCRYFYYLNTVNTWLLFYIILILYQGPVQIDLTNSFRKILGVFYAQLFLLIKALHEKILTFCK